MPRRPAVDRFLHERARFASGIERVAGVDEAGRGPLAGPVVAAAVILPRSWVLEGIPNAFADLNDSKQLTEAQRDRFFAGLTGDPAVRFAIAAVGPSVIDEINILQATLLAMQRAVAGLRLKPNCVLVDGNRLPPWNSNITISPWRTP